MEGFMLKDKMYLVGYALGIAGVDSHAGEGPLVIQNSPFLLGLANQGHDYEWEAMIYPRTTNSLTVEENISQSCTALAETVTELTRKKLPFCVVGGDHSCA